MNKKSQKYSHITKLCEEKENLVTDKNLHENITNELKEKITASEKELSEMKVKMQSLSISASSDEESLQSLYKERQILELKLKTVTLTLSALKSAYENIQKNFTPALNKIASGYFRIISGGKYERIFCDESLNIRVDADLPRESSFFSGGTIDQLYLSARLGLIDMLFEKKSCPLLLDQPFLQYDEDRKKRTVELLGNLGENRQILLFTADSVANCSNISTQILT